MTSWMSRPASPNLEVIEPPVPVKVTSDMGPFVGRSGMAVARDECFLWVRFDPGGSYAPCDRPGVYGMQHSDVSVSS